MFLDGADDDFTIPCSVVGSLDPNRNKGSIAFMRNICLAHIYMSLYGCYNYYQRHGLTEFRFSLYIIGYLLYFLLAYFTRFSNPFCLKRTLDLYCIHGILWMMEDFSVAFGHINFIIFYRLLVVKPKNRAWGQSRRTRVGKMITSMMNTISQKYNDLGYVTQNKLRIGFSLFTCVSDQISDLIMIIIPWLPDDVKLGSVQLNQIGGSSYLSLILAGCFFFNALLGTYFHYQDPIGEKSATSYLLHSLGLGTLSEFLKLDKEWLDKPAFYAARIREGFFEAIPSAVANFVFLLRVDDDTALLPTISGFLSLLSISNVILKYFGTEQTLFHQMVLIWMILSDSIIRIKCMYGVIKFTWDLRYLGDAFFIGSICFWSIWFVIHIIIVYYVTKKTQTTWLHFIVTALFSSFSPMIILTYAREGSKLWFYELLFWIIPMIFTAVVESWKYNFGWPIAINFGYWVCTLLVLLEISFANSGKLFPNVDGTLHRQALFRSFLGSQSALSLSDDDDWITIRKSPTQSEIQMITRIRSRASSAVRMSSLGSEIPDDFDDSSDQYEFEDSNPQIVYAGSIEAGGRRFSTGI